MRGRPKIMSTVSVSSHFSVLGEGDRTSGRWGQKHLATVHFGQFSPYVRIRANQHSCSNERVRCPWAPRRRCQIARNCGSCAILTQTNEKSRCARRAPAAPPNAIPIWRCIWGSRPVRRECATMSSDKSLTKILRLQCRLARRKRRTVSAMSTARPCQGRSANRRV